MKRRLIVAVICAVAAAFAALEAAGNLDLLIRQGARACTLNPAVLLRQVLLGFPGKAFWLFLILFALGIVGILWALFGATTSIGRSGMYTVVPGFKIPKSAGQGQYGTAWWMEENEFDICFQSAHTPSELPLNRELEERYAKERRCIHGKH